MTPEMSEQVSKQLASFAARAYRDALRHGYRRPVATARFLGVIREDGGDNLRGEVNAGDFPNMIKRLPPGMVADLMTGPAGCFPCIITDEGPEPPSIVWYPLPEED
jgi:hypothetical protein